MKSSVGGYNDDVEDHHPFAGTTTRAFVTTTTMLLLLFTRVAAIQTTINKTAAAASEKKSHHHPKTEIVVVGTNHNSASDAEKVTRVIEDVEPDVVVVELDFERMNSFFDESFFMQRRRRRIPLLLKGGGDFMNAVKSGTTTTTTTSKPPPIVILGDVKMKEIPEMLLNKAMMNPGFGGLAYFLESFKGAFGVAPTASVVTMTLACTLVDNNFIELFVLLYGVSVVSDVLLKDRDVILAENVIKGVDIAKRLRKKELLSKQFTFSSSSSSLTNNDDDDDDVCDEKEEEDAALPVFTLKRPFENKDEIRRLNLFEPRWLAMLDEIANRNDGSLVGAKLGVVLAQNRLYTPANFDKIEQQKRVASIVFDPFVQRAKVVDAKESTRPVTGARKVEVFIALDSETNDDFIGDFREAPGQRGYMLASKKLEKKTTTTTTTTTTSKESTIGQRRRRRENDVLLRDDVNDDDDAKKKKTTTTKPPTPIACVVVCGKLHVRGVVGRLLSRENSSFFFDDDSRRQSRFQSRRQSDEKSGYRSSRSSIKVM